MIPDKSSYNKERYYRLISKGLCVSCGGTGRPGKRKCLDCLNRTQLRENERMARKALEGRCSRCGTTPVLPSYTDKDTYRLCEKCYLKNTSNSRTGSGKNWETLRNKLRLQEYKCPYSGEHIVLGINDSVDHIYPVSRFPDLRSDPDNLEWVSRRVNQAKNNMTKYEFISMVCSIHDNLDKK